MAARLRLFVITWDPLERLVDRPYGFATMNADPSGSELVVYLPVWSLLEQAGEQKVTVGGVLTAIGGSAVVAAAADERPELADGRAARGLTRRDLLADRAAGRALGVPRMRLVSPGWEDIGLGAITDIVQAAFGPVDLDRSAVELTAAARPHAGCPPCRGRRFGFPGELAEAQAGMCPTHHREAETVIRTRLARANASNPDGWAALTGASIRLGLPHLPNGLATKLATAWEGMYVVPEPQVLAERARAVVEAAGWFPDRRDDFAVALGADPDLAALLPDWVINLVLDLGRAGLGAEAVAVADALTGVDAALQSMLDGDVAVALAEAGLAEQARARVESNLARWLDDVWIRLHAGDALAVLGDPDGAVDHFTVAVTMADESGDVEARSAALHRLRRIGRSSPVDPGSASSRRRQPRRQPRSRRRPKR